MAEAPGFRPRDSRLRVAGGPTSGRLFGILQEIDEWLGFLWPSDLNALSQASSCFHSMRVDADLSAYAIVNFAHGVILCSAQGRAYKRNVVTGKFLASTLFF